MRRVLAAISLALVAARAGAEPSEAIVRGLAYNIPLRLQLVTGGGVVFTGGTLTSPLTVPVGSAAAPSINFTGDTTTGIFQDGAGVIGLSSIGTPVFDIWASGIRTINSAQFLWSSTAGQAAADTGLGRDGAAGVKATNGGSGFGYIKSTYPTVTSAVGPTIASAATIAPVQYITFISGTAAIGTITAPTGIASTGGCIVLVPTGIFTTTTAGNIALASTAVVSKALHMCYDATTVKWYPSY